VCCAYQAVGAQHIHKQGPTPTPPFRDLHQHPYLTEEGYAEGVHAVLMPTVTPQTPICPPLHCCCGRRLHIKLTPHATRFRCLFAKAKVVFPPGGGFYVAAAAAATYTAAAPVRPLCKRTREPLCRAARKPQPTPPSLLAVPFPSTVSVRRGACDRQGRARMHPLRLLWMCD